MRGAGTQGQAQWLCPLWPLRPPPRLDPKGEKVLLLAGVGPLRLADALGPGTQRPGSAGRLHLRG